MSHPNFRKASSASIAPTVILAALILIGLGALVAVLVYPPDSNQNRAMVSDENGSLSLVGKSAGSESVFLTPAGEEVQVILRGGASLKEAHAIVVQEVRGASERGVKLDWVKIQSDGRGGTSITSGIKGSTPNPPPTEGLMDFFPKTYGK